jgi:DNA-binding XRE family transcriptional regulator
MTRLHGPRFDWALAGFRARQRVGQWPEDEKFAQKGLAALRMKAGLSQKILADRLGTKQSNVSRWEKSPGDMQFSTIMSWALALNVQVDVVCKAIATSTDAACRCRWCWKRGRFV